MFFKKEKVFDVYLERMKTLRAEVRGAEKELERATQDAEIKRIALTLCSYGLSKDYRRKEYEEAQKKLYFKMARTEEAIREHNNKYREWREHLPEGWQEITKTPYEIVQEAIKNFYNRG